MGSRPSCLGSHHSRSRSVKRVLLHHHTSCKPFPEVAPDEISVPSEMLVRLLNQLKSSSNRGKPDRFRLGLEVLEDRVVPANLAVQVFDDGVPVSMTQPIPGTFIGSSADFSLTIVSGASNNPGTPSFADLQLTTQSEVQVTAPGTHTLTIELTDTGFTSPSGTPLTLSSSAGGEVVTASSDMVTANYQGVLDSTNTPFGNGSGVPLGAPPRRSRLIRQVWSQQVPAGTRFQLVYTPGTSTNLVPSATPFSMTDIATFTFSSASSGDYVNVGATTAAAPSPVASPTINTVPGGTVVVGSGSALTDSATLSGGDSPTGTVTFWAPARTGGHLQHALEQAPFTQTRSRSAAMAPPARRRAPTRGGYVPTGTGGYQWVAVYSGDPNNFGATSNFGDEPENVTPNTPAITTSQTPAIAFVGQPISDKATVTGLVSPSSGDTVTFNLYSSATVQNSSTLLHTDTETVSINGSTATATSAGYTPTGVGTVYWVATFSGDSNNSAVTSGAAAEQVNVDTITTSQTPATATIGQPISDTATVSGLVSPSSSDTVTFNLYSSATVQNSSTLLHSDTETVTLGSGGTATASSNSYTPTGVGTVYWVATFNGDSSNAAVTSGAAAEQVNVDTITTSQTPAFTATIGQPISDTATVTGLVSPSSSDTVTFNLYSSATVQNSSTLLHSDTETVSISGSTATATSAGYTPTGVGTVYWVATFNGDSSNAAVTSGAAAEQVNVDTITTSQTPAKATVGESISDTATVTGLVSASAADTVTFNLYSSPTTQNSTTLLYTDTETVTLGSGSTATATSPGYTTTGVGTEYWVATFNGDTNNAAVTSGATAEQVNVDTINTMQTPATATIGQPISDTATVSGLVSPSSSDTVTFNLYSSATVQNSSTLLHSDTETVSISGSTATATSAGYTPTGVGTVYWVATFSGDSNNSAVTSGAAAEQVNVDTITTSQTPATATIGQPISDTATVTRPGQPQQQRHGHLQPLQQRHGPEQLHAARQRHRDRHHRQRQHGHRHVAGVHDHRSGHGILGGHLQRRYQQRRRHQRHVGRAGERRQDHHQPDAGNRHHRPARSATPPRSRAWSTPAAAIR